MKKLIIFLFICSALLSQDNQNPVTISASVDGTARAGEVINVEILAAMEDQWHIYSIYDLIEGPGPLPTEITISGNVVGAVAPVQEPKPNYVYDPGFEMDTYYHKGNTTFNLPVRLKRNLEPGKYTIAIDVFYMVCNARLCYPPVTKTDSVVIIVDPGLPRESKANFRTVSNIGSDDSLTGDSRRSLLSILFLAIGGAIISWIMPCVYPMIPIIISFFGKMSEDKNVSRNTIAIFYGAGIAGTFVLIGLIVGILSWGIDDTAMKTKYANIGNFIATDPYVNLFLGILFIFFALWMFGIVNVNIGGNLANKSDKVGRSANSAYLSSLLLGFTFSITSFSCTVPVVGTLLVIAASGNTGAIFSSLFGMVIYGVVFAAPFVALSLFPKIIDKLPNSGSWMNTVKVAFGFIEVAAAIKFLWVPDLEWGIGLLPRNVVLGLFIVIGLTMIIYLLGIIRMGHEDSVKPFQIGISRIVIIIFTLASLYPIGMSFASPPTYHYPGMPRLIDEFIEALVPPPPIEDEIAIKEGWFVDNYDEALLKAKEEAKPLFIDFTGVYCANCRVMERRVFPKKSVKEQLDKMVLARLYVDKKDSLSQVYAQMQFERYKQATQPYYVILDPKNESTLVDTGGYIPNGFEDFLLKGLSLYNQNSNNN